MNIQDQLARVIAGDCRFTIEGYIFVLESLKLARTRKLLRRKRADQSRAGDARPKSPSSRRRERGPDPSGHVTGRELCLAARRLAVRNYGSLARIVLDQWGIRSTSDIGSIVYNLIDSGDLDTSSGDQRSDFDDVYDFETALRPRLFLGRDVAD